MSPNDILAKQLRLSLQVLEFNGGLAGARTRDQRIKSIVRPWREFAFCLAFNDLRIALSASKTPFRTEIVNISPTKI